MGLLIEEKQVVIPGQELAEGMDYLPAQGTYRDGDKIFANQLGIISLSGRLVKIIPLSGRYIPKEGDFVIGKITNVNFSSWSVDIGYAYEAQLSLKEATSDFIERGDDLTQYFNFGDVVMTKIINVTKSKAIDLTMKGPGLRKLVNGRIITITPAKVPRVIGKQGSMITLIKDLTGCRISVGQNGLIWIAGEAQNNEDLAIKAIAVIDKEAHTEGLTDRIKEYLDAERQKLGMGPAPSSHVDNQVDNSTQEENFQ